MRDLYIPCHTPTSKHHQDEQDDKLSGTFCEASDQHIDLIDVVVVDACERGRQRLVGRNVREGREARQAIELACIVVERQAEVATALDIGRQEVLDRSGAGNDVAQLRDIERVDSQRVLRHEAEENRVDIAVDARIRVVETISQREGLRNRLQRERTRERESESVSHYPLKLHSCSYLAIDSNHGTVELRSIHDHGHVREEQTVGRCIDAI